MKGFLDVLHCFKDIQSLQRADTKEKETVLSGWGCVAVIIVTLFCSIMLVVSYLFGNTFTTRNVQIPCQTVKIKRNGT